MSAPETEKIVVNDKCGHVKFTTEDMCLSIALNFIIDDEVDVNVE